MRNFIVNMFVVLHAFAITFGISVISLVKTFFGMNHIQSVDHRLQYWSRMLLNRIRLKCLVNDQHHLVLEKGRPYIFMCNHSSLYDVPISITTLPGSIRMLVKKELINIPIWGNAMLASGFKSIDRHNKQQAFADLEEAKKAMEAGTVLWIAPEGTRSKDGKLMPFKKGGFRLAIDTGATIVPIGFRGAHEILPGKSFSVNIGKTVHVNIGKPIDAALYSHQTREKLIIDVESQIRELMQLTA